jgi:glyoxylase-like metal-dependent hydrolase (beta-lactamase superfamily II)
VCGNDCCLIIDAGNSPKHANELKREIESMDLPPVKYLVVTHHHWDHTFGLSEWDVVTIANQITYEYMKTYCKLKYDDYSLEEAKKNKIFKDISIKSIKDEIEQRENFHPKNCTLSFSGEITIDLGGITCYIRQIVSPHTDDSTIVYIPEERMLFLGDCNYGYTSQGYNYYNKELMELNIKAIEQYDAEYYLCSHESVCTKEEMEAYWKQLRMGAKITETCNNIDEAIIEYKKIYHTEPNSDDIFFMRSFGVGKTWGREMDLKPEIF